MILPKQRLVPYSLTVLLSHRVAKTAGCYSTDSGFLILNTKPHKKKHTIMLTVAVVGNNDLFSSTGQGSFNRASTELGLTADSQLIPHLMYTFPRLSLWQRRNSRI